MSARCDICGDTLAYCNCDTALRDGSQNKQLFALLNKFHIQEDLRRDMVLEFTQMRTYRSSLMTKRECQNLITSLRQRLSYGDKTRGEQANQMRKKVYALAHELGWEQADGKVNQDTLNQWLLKYGCLHKPLAEYTVKELPQLLSQLENILAKTYGKES